MYLSKPENHIAMVMASLASTIIIGFGLWTGLSGLFDSEPQSLKLYAALVSSGLAYLLLLCGLIGFVLKIVAFARVRKGQEKGQHSSHWP